MKMVKIFLKDLYLRTKHIILNSQIDFVQLTLSWLYAFAFLIFFNNWTGVVKTYPLDFQITYLFLIQGLPPYFWCLLFFLLWIIGSYDCLNLNRKHRELKFTYLIGPALWLYLSVGVFMDFGLILTVGVYLYLFTHSTWLYFRY